AAIDVAAAFALEYGGEVLGALVAVAGGDVQGFVGRAVLRAGQAVGMEDAGGKVARHRWIFSPSRGGQRRINPARPPALRGSAAAPGRRPRWSPATRLPAGGRPPRNARARCRSPAPARPPRSCARARRAAGRG